MARTFFIILLCSLPGWGQITLSQNALTFTAVGGGINPYPCGNTTNPVGCPNLITVTNTGGGTATITLGTPSIGGQTQQRLFPELCTTASNGDPCATATTIAPGGTALLFNVWDDFAMTEAAWQSAGTHTGSYTVTSSTGCTGSCLVSITFNIVTKTATPIKTLTGAAFPSGCSGTSNSICPPNPTFAPSIGGMVAPAVGSTYTDVMFNSTWRIVTAPYTPLAMDSEGQAISSDGTMSTGSDLFGHTEIYNNTTGTLINTFVFGTNGFAWPPHDNTQMIYLDGNQPPGISSQAIAGGAPTSLYSFPLTTGGTCSFASQAFCLQNQIAGNISENGYYAWTVVGDSGHVNNGRVGVTKVIAGFPVDDGISIGTTYTATLPSNTTNSGYPGSANGWVDNQNGEALITPGRDSVSHKQYVIIGCHGCSSAMSQQQSQFVYSFDPLAGSPTLVYESRMPELEGGYDHDTSNGKYYRGPHCSDAMALAPLPAGTCGFAPHTALSQDSTGQQMSCSTMWNGASFHSHPAVSCSYFNRGVDLMAIPVEVGGGTMLNQTALLGPPSLVGSFAIEEHVGGSNIGLMIVGFEGPGPGVTSSIGALATSGSDMALTTLSAIYSTGNNIWVGNPVGCSSAIGYWPNVTVSGTTATLAGTTCNTAWPGANPRGAPHGSTTIAGNPPLIALAPELQILDVRTPNQMTVWRIANNHALMYNSSQQYYMQSHPNINSQGTEICNQSDFGMPDQVQYACTPMMSEILGIVTTPLLVINKTGGPFNQGQTNATYNSIVTNQGTGPTDGTTVTVTDTIPSGLALISMSGSGWTCVTNTCTRSDVLSTSSSYPPITITVNVGTLASSPQVNTIQVSGGGSSTFSTSNSTTINSAVFPSKGGSFIFGTVHITGQMKSQRND